ncbi:hypothetical protein ACN28S_50055 [Cystobacter fuscus]
MREAPAAKSTAPTIAALADAPKPRRRSHRAVRKLSEVAVNSQNWKAVSGGRPTARQAAYSGSTPCSGSE